MSIARTLTRSDVNWIKQNESITDSIEIDRVTSKYSKQQLISELEEFDMDRDAQALLNESYAKMDYSKAVEKNDLWGRSRRSIAYASVMLSKLKDMREKDAVNNVFFAKQKPIKVHKSRLIVSSKGKPFSRKHHTRVKA